jgi:hypothetical protein
VEILSMTVDGIQLFDSGPRINAIYDNDDMSPNDATGLATQQSIKAYVDNSFTAFDDDRIVAGDSSIIITDAGTGQIDITVDSGAVGQWLAAGLTVTGTVASDGFILGNTEGFVLGDGGVLVGSSGGVTLFESNGTTVMASFAEGGGIQLRYNGSIQGSTVSGAFRANTALQINSSQLVTGMTGADLTLVTGTGGTANLGRWNADGDLVESASDITDPELELLSDGSETTLHKHPANYITVTDVGGFYDAVEVEDALREIGEHLGFRNGTFHESFDALVTSDGATVTLTLEQSGGGDLEMTFSSGHVTLDCTDPIQSIVLTAGTDSAPQDNYVYIPESTKVLTVHASQWPSEEHIKVAYVLVPSATEVQTDGAYINQNWNDHTTGTDGQGHMAHMGEAIRLTMGGASWHSGIDGNGDASTYLVITGSPNEVYFKSTAGVCYQMHRHTVPAFDMQAGGDDMHVVNWNADAYHSITDMASIQADANGVSLSNKYFNLIIWATANKTGQYSPLMCNLPTGSYNQLSQALVDLDNYDVSTIPGEYVQESTTGFLICRLTLRYSGTTWTLHGTKDLRGIPAGSAAGTTSIAPGVLTEFPDNTFTIYDSDDVSKVLVFDLAGITTANTRTITPADADMTLLSTAQYTDLTDAGATTLHKHDHGGMDGLGDDDHTQYILHSLATAANDFLIASGSGAFVKKTLAEAGAILEGDIVHGNLQGVGDGSDHSFIDQDVTSGSSPLFGSILAKAGETGINFNADGATDLYYDNAKVVATNAKGLDLWDSTGDEVTINFYSDGDVLLGNIVVTSSGTYFQLGASSENAIVTTLNGAVALYYDASVKLATTTGGVTVTGSVVANGLTLSDNQYITLGAGPDATIYSDGTSLTISNGATDEEMATFTQNGAVKLYYDNSIQMETVSGALKATNAFVIGATTQVTGILDEDNLGSDSATSLATQQSIKAYVDAGGGGGGASDRHGFSDLSDQTRLWTPGTNTYTITKITANWECWIQGEDFVQTAVMTSTISSPAGGTTYYFYLYDNSGTLTLTYKTSWTAADYEDKLLCHQVEYTNVWDNYFTAVIDNTKIDADLTNFPCLITISTAAGTGNEDLSAVFDELTSDANRKKIKVTTDSQGITECYAEIERWDDANEEAYIWVRVPSVSSSADTTLYIWYDSSKSDNDTYVGDVASTPGQAVWDANYISVYHLHEDPTGTPAATDSTGDHDLTMSGTMLAGDLVDGQIGKCLDFDGTDDYLYETNGYDPNGDTECTMEAWGAATALASNETIFINHSGSGYSVMLFNNSGKMQFWVYSGGNRIAVSTAAPSADGSFEYYAGSWKSGEGPNVFIDTAKDTGTVRTGTINRTGYDDWIIGDLPGGSGERTWEGRIDEVRYSNIKRSDAWLKATYHAGADTLIEYGATTATGGAAGDNADRAYEYFDHPAERVVIDKTEFANILSSTDTDLQTALETIDDHLLTDHSDGLKIQGRKNIIINGDMRVAQRGTSFTGLTAGDSTEYNLDRWNFLETGTITGVMTITQDTDVPTGQGFANSLKIDVTTADAAIGVDDSAMIAYGPEAQDLQHLAWGTNDAKSVNISFWLKSDTKTGVFSVSLRNIDNAATYAHAFTVADNLWNKYSVTIPGDPDNGFNDDNGVGMRIQFALACGTSKDVSVNDAWNDAESAYGAIGQANFLDSTDNNVWITGVQLEVNTVATDFEYRSYAEELTLCKRYYERFDESVDTDERFAVGYAENTSQAKVLVKFEVEKRALDYSLYTSGTAADYGIEVASTNRACTSVPAISVQSRHTCVLNLAESGANLTAGDGCFGYFLSGADGYLGFDAEL